MRLEGHLTVVMEIDHLYLSNVYSALLLTLVVVHACIDR